MDISDDLRAAIARYSGLGRWERAELGRGLRRLGLSYGEILELIPVPKGTLAGWCRDIRLTRDQIAAIKQRRGPASGPRDTQWRRRLEVERIRREAISEAEALVADPFWVAGTVLYWGEGSKTKRSLAVANADPRLLRLFVSWCRAYHDPSAEFVMSLHLHAGNDERSARAFWSAELGFDEYTKTFIKPPGTGHRKNKLPHGVCRVRMRRSTDEWIRTMQWIETLGSEQSRLANLLDGSLAQSGRATDS